MLASRGYSALLVVSALIGVPVALVAFGFLALVTNLEDWVWASVPEALGWDQPAAWYAVVVLVVAGLLVGLVVTYLPGRGGHLPAKGFAGGMPSSVELPGVFAAALLSLVLGAVVGPEAPLVALGGGLVLFVASQTKLAEQPQGMKLLAVAGSAAAIATLFGNPLVAAVLMLEVVGLAGSQVLLVLLPCLASAGIGSVVFIGLGSWTGIDVPSLTIPGLPTAPLDAGDIVWVLPGGCPRSRRSPGRASPGTPDGSVHGSAHRGHDRAGRARRRALRRGVQLAHGPLADRGASVRRGCPAEPPDRTRDVVDHDAPAAPRCSRVWRTGSRWGPSEAARHSPRCSSGL